MNDKLDTSQRQKKKAVRTALILGAVVLGYYTLFIFSHLK